MCLFALKLTRKFGCEMKIAVIIVSGGSGIRAGGDIPKQYQQINGAPVLLHTLQAFSGFTTLCVVSHPDHEAYIAPIFSTFNVEIIRADSGTTRTLSVKSGLAALESHNPDIVLIHDAARPFVSHHVIADVLSALKTVDGAAPALSVIDAIKTIDFDAVDRNQLRAVQTPQGFHYEKLWPLYRDMDENADFADDIEVAKHGGLNLAFSQGDPANKKITFAKDFDMTTPYGPSVSAQGFDVHSTEPGTSITLGGITFDSPVSLVGHSDADVALHALTDAMLGCIGAGDIGSHFPPTDQQWRGASSDRFFTHALSLIKKDGAKLIHLDLTIICERPKVGPHREVIRQSIANLSGLPLARVSVKATTTEKLGFTGRGEGIAAMATASVQLPL